MVLFVKIWTKGRKTNKPGWSCNLCHDSQDVESLRDAIAGSNAHGSKCPVFNGPRAA